MREPRKPKLVLAPAASPPLYATLRAVTADPLLLTVAPQDEPTFWPSAYVQVTVQPVKGAVPAVTLTSAWKPPFHCPVIA